jgi:hypothetical protein
MAMVNRDLLVFSGVFAATAGVIGAAAWFFMSQAPPPPPVAAPVAATPAPVKPAPEPQLTSWAAAGFKKWPGQDVAYRWSDSRYRPGCRDGNVCMQVEVYAISDCDSLYVSASLFDSNDLNIGYTNGTTSGLRAGETALIALNASEGATRSMRISEINCT